MGLITADSSSVPSPSLSGPKLIKLFNLFGVNDEYTSEGLPGNVSRAMYTENTLNKLNNSIEFRNLIEHLVETRRIDNADDVAKKINSIIRYDGYELKKNSKEIYKVIGGNLSSPADIEAHFKNIRCCIIEQIRKARFTIWVAVAWFTDKKIGNELWKRHQQGLNIQVIVNDDDTTSQRGLKFNEHEIEYYTVSPNTSFGKKLMHNKFAIFDFETVIHGSYNWTNNAQYNDENITTTIDRALAQDFAAKFIELKVSARKTLTKQKKLI